MRVRVISGELERRASGYVARLEGIDQVTVGDTLERAIDNAADAILGYFDVCREHGRLEAMVGRLPLVDIPGEDVPAPGLVVLARLRLAGEPLARAAAPGAGTLELPLLAIA